jgi:hypothetical protein
MGHFRALLTDLANSMGIRPLQLPSHPSASDLGGRSPTSATEPQNRLVRLTCAEDMLHRRWPPAANHAVGTQAVPLLEHSPESGGASSPLAPTEF